MLLIAPVFIFTLIVLVLTCKIIEVPRTKVFYVLFSLSLFTIMETFWIDPEIGAIRDWDLLAISGFPLTIFGLFMIVSLEGKNILDLRPVIGMVIVALVAVIPNIIEKNNVNIALSRIDKVLWEDAHYQVDYDNAERAVRWGYLLENTFKKHEMARRYFERRRSTEVGLSEFLSVLEDYQKRVESNPRDPTGRTALAATLSGLKLYGEALTHFRVAYELKPDYNVAVFNMGFIFEKMNHFDSAYFYFKKGLKLTNNVVPNIDVFKSLFNCSINLNLTKDAAWALKQIEYYYPDYEHIDSLKILLPN